MLPRTDTSVLGRQMAFTHSAHGLSHQQAVIAGLNTSNHSDYISILYIYNMQKWYIFANLVSATLIVVYCQKGTFFDCCSRLTECCICYSVRVS